MIIAGSDSAGGAGIQADIKTVTSLGSYAMTAVTAITSQNTTGVMSIVSIEPKEISKQIEFTAKDIKPDAIKVGMLHSFGAINPVIQSLNRTKTKKIISNINEVLKQKRWEEDESTIGKTLNICLIGEASTRF